MQLTSNLQLSPYRSLNPNRLIKLRILKCLRTIFPTVFIRNFWQWLRPPLSTFHRNVTVLDRGLSYQQFFWLFRGPFALLFECWLYLIFLYEHSLELKLSYMPGKFYFRRHFYEFLAIFSCQYSPFVGSLLLFWDIYGSLFLPWHNW